jgi:hypothetical protein
MRSSRIAFWIYALPIFSLLIAGFSVGFQYYKGSREVAELKRDEAEISRLEPKSHETYDPGVHDKTQ